MRKSKVVHVKAKKAYGQVEAKLYSFLIGSLNGGEWSPSHNGHFTPSTH